jgi:glycosyltransferase involved in cell wall biosynthesis
MPEATIIMTVYNGEAYIAEAIGGVLAQTCPDWELIVINDGSTDRSGEIARGYGDPRIRVVDRPNQGQPASRNYAASIAQAPYLAICDADDVWCPEKLQRQLDYVRAHRDVGVAGVRRILMINAVGEPLGVHMTPGSDGRLRRALARGVNPFTHSALVWRAEVFHRLGGYNLRFLYSQDFEMLLRAQDVCRLANVDGPPLLKYRVSGGAISQSKRAVQAGYKKAAMVLAQRRRQGGADDVEAALAQCLPKPSEGPAPAGPGGAAAGAPPARDLNLSYAKVAMACGSPWRAARFLVRSVRQRFRPHLALLALVVVLVPGPILRGLYRGLVRLYRGWTEGTGPL